jgi:hypothetical protein
MAIINREYIDGEFNDVSNFPFRPSNSGSLAMFAAIRRASSRVKESVDLRAAKLVPQTALRRHKPSLNRKSTSESRFRLF